MHVGVFPFFALGLLTALRLPHARGGVSNRIIVILIK